MHRLYTYYMLGHFYTGIKHPQILVSVRGTGTNPS